MPTITLWHMSGSPPSWTVRMMAEILGLQVDAKEIDFGAKEHKSPEFLKINPIGTVPVIQDGDFVISESHTIMNYLLSKYGTKQQQEQYYPSELRARAAVDQAMYFDTGVAFIRVKVICLPALFEGVSEITPKVKESVDEVYAITEDFLTRNQYIAGDKFTIGDLSVGSTITALDALCKLDVKKYPRTAAWLKKLHSESFFKNIAVPGSEILAQVIQSVWAKNKGQ